jgi:Uma2 family endonuclease
MTLREKLTAAQFDAFVRQPANADKVFEFIGGEIVEVPSNPFVSDLAGLFIFFLRLYLRERGLRGHVTGEAGGYIVSGERYAPDVAYLAYDRQPELPKAGYNPLPPDLAIEIVSSNRVDELDKLRIKITNYLAAGTVVWVVKPEAQQIEIHSAGQPVQVLRHDDTLDGGALLPGFALRLDELFG